MTIPAICQIVPTKDHPELLRRLFESLRGQEQHLKQLVIVDGGTEQRVEELCAEYGWLPISYTHVSPPGLARQRNVGLEMVDDACNLVGFWDDDLVIEPGCLEALRRFWEQAGPEVGGSECNIVVGAAPLVDQGRLRNLLDRVFVMPGASQPRGVILRSGANVTIFPAEETQEVGWICGGANLYRREIFDRFTFDEWYNGYGLGDDVEFSYQVALAYQLWVIAEARVQHLMLPMNRRQEYLYGRIWATNQLHFVSKHGFNRLLGAWCVFGMALRHVIGGLRTGNRYDLHRARGYLSALPPFLLGRLKPVDRQVK